MVNSPPEQNAASSDESHATMPVIPRRIPEDMIAPVARYLAGR